MSMQIEFDTYQHFYNIMLNLSCTLCINNNNVLSDTGCGKLPQIMKFGLSSAHIVYLYSCINHNRIIYVYI